MSQTLPLSKCSCKIPIHWAYGYSFCTSPEIPSFSPYLPCRACRWAVCEATINTSTPPEDKICFAVLFNHPWCSITQLFPCLMDGSCPEVRWMTFQLPWASSSSCLSEKRNSTNEHTEHIQGQWKSQPALGFLSVLTSNFCSFYTTRGTYCREDRLIQDMQWADALIKGWLAEKHPFKGKKQTTPYTPF